MRRHSASTHRIQGGRRLALPSLGLAEVVWISSNGIRQRYHGDKKKDENG